MLHANSWWRAIGLMLIIAFAVALYLSLRKEYFHSSDWIWIQALLHKPLPTLVWDQIYRGSPWEYRPFSSFYLLILHWIFGDWAPGFYASNVFLHSFNAGLVYCIAVRLGLSELSSWTAALLFLVHPAPFTSFIWINDSSVLLQLHFALWAIFLLLGFFRSGSRRLQYASILAALASMLTKESGVITVLLPPLMDVFYRSHLSISRLRPYLLLLAALIVYLPLSLSFSPGWREYPDVYKFGPHILANLFYTLGFLLTMPNRPLPEPLFWTKALGILVPVVAVVAFRNWKTGGFMSAWIILAALPTSLFVTPGGFDTTGRYTYSCLVPFCLAIGEVLHGVSVAFQKRGQLVLY